MTISRELTALIVASLVFGLSSAVASAQPAEPNPASHYIQPPLTKDRLRDDDMRALVHRPLDEMLGGDVPTGERDFEALVKERSAHDGSATVAVADTLAAMGTLLFWGASDAQNESLRTKAVAYLRRAIVATKAAFGADNPEVALALNDYADAMIKMNPSNPGTETEADLQEVYQIRLATLGPFNSETVDGLSDLAMVKGLPARNGGDAAKIAEASNLFTKAIEGAQHNAAYASNQIGDLYLQVAKFWAANNNESMASDYFTKFENQYRLVTDQISDTLANGAVDVASALENSGHKTEAEALRKRYATQIADMVSRAKHIP